MAVFRKTRVDFIERSQNREFFHLAQHLRIFCYSSSHQKPDSIKIEKMLWSLIQLGFRFFSSITSSLLSSIGSESKSYHLSRKVRLQNCQQICLIGNAVVRRNPKTKIDFCWYQSSTSLLSAKTGMISGSKIPRKGIQPKAKTTGLDCCRFWLLHEKLQRAKNEERATNVGLAQTQLKLRLGNIVITIGSYHFSDSQSLEIACWISFNRFSVEISKSDEEKLFEKSFSAIIPSTCWWFWSSKNAVFFDFYR